MSMENSYESQIAIFPGAHGIWSCYTERPFLPSVLPSLTGFLLMCNKHVVVKSFMQRECCHLTPVLLWCLWCICAAWTKGASTPTLQPWHQSWLSQTCHKTFVPPMSRYRLALPCQCHKESQLLLELSPEWCGDAGRVAGGRRHFWVGESENRAEQEKEEDHKGVTLAVASSSKSNPPCFLMG